MKVATNIHCLKAYSISGIGSKCHQRNCSKKIIIENKINTMCIRKPTW